MATVDTTPPSRVIACPDCGARCLAAEHDGVMLLFDPEPVDEPDGEGRCVVFLNRTVNSTIFDDVRGRFPTYRGHPWSCTARGDR